MTDAILDATRDLLLDIGYAAVTIDAIAAKAGVSKPTVYRRYPTKAAIIFDAVFGKTKAKGIPETGRIADDLRQAYSWAVDEFAAPEARAALPGLLADLTANPTLSQFIRALVLEPEYIRVHHALEQAQARGDISPDADLTLAIDAFTGTALARVLLLDRPVDHAFGDRLVDLILYGLAPRT